MARYEYLPTYRKVVEMIVLLEQQAGRVEQRETRQINLYRV
jgi:hypothetical protein